MTAEPQPIRPHVSREILEDRWRGAIDGDHDSDYGDLFNADGLALIELLNLLVGKVARGPWGDVTQIDVPGQYSVSIIDECIEAIHEAIVSRIDELGVAR